MIKEINWELETSSLDDSVFVVLWLFMTNGFRLRSRMKQLRNKTLYEEKVEVLVIVVFVVVCCYVFVSWHEL